MEDLVEILALILSSVACSSVLLVIGINLYFKIRRCYPVKVNCWFCNQWTRVAYDEQNSFECSVCLQYNGFREDGDYNRAIPAQHDELLNQSIHGKSYRKRLSPGNGLCHICNNNQHLKVYQLANFVPLDETNYDVEIEHFQKQLEKAYKLCHPCEQVLKRTLCKQNALLGLKFADFRRKGMQFLDLNSSRGGISRENKMQFVKTLLRYALIAFIFLNLGLILAKVDFSDRNLKKTAPKWAREYVFTAKAAFVNVWNYFKNGLKRIIDDVDLTVVFKTAENWLNAGRNLLKTVLEVPLVANAYSHLNLVWEKFYELLQPLLSKLQHMDKGTAVVFSGIILQFISLLLDNDSFFKKIVLLVLWTAIMYLQLHLTPNYVYYNVAQITLSVLIATLLLKRNKVNTKKKSFKYIAKRQARVSEYSDNEEEAFQTSCKTKRSVSKHRDSNVSEPYSEDLNHSFRSTKSHLSDKLSLPETASVYCSSFVNDVDLNLDKLHLGDPTVTNLQKPILSPPKLKNVTQNSWVAGGFWRNSSGVIFPSASLSRSSSQTSGFVSQTNPFNSLPSSANNSFCGDFDSSSVVSDPVCSNNDFQSRPNLNVGTLNTRLRYHNDMYRSFYPILNQEMVYIAPCSFPHIIPHISPNRCTSVSPTNFLFNSPYTFPNVGTRIYQEKL